MFTPDTAQVMYIYGVTKKGDNTGKGTWVGNLGDVRHWIEDSRDRERFWVTTVLLSLLSMWVAFLGLKSEKGK